MLINSLVGLSGEEDEEIVLCRFVPLLLPYYSMTNIKADSGYVCVGVFRGYVRNELDEILLAQAAKVADPAE